VQEAVIVDEDAVAHGGWWKCTKLQDISGSISIEFQDGQYVKSLDDGTFTLGVKHPAGEGPGFDEELTAFIVNDSKIYIKSGYGKYMKVESNNVITGRSDAAGNLVKSILNYFTKSSNFFLN
jgi:protein FRG1